MELERSVRKLADNLSHSKFSCLDSCIVPDFFVWCQVNTFVTYNFLDFCCCSVCCDCSPLNCQFIQITRKNLLEPRNYSMYEFQMKFNFRSIALFLSPSSSLRFISRTHPKFRFFRYISIKNLSNKHQWSTHICFVNTGTCSTFAPIKFSKRDRKRILRTEYSICP